MKSNVISRGGFVGQMSLASAAALLMQAPEFLPGDAWMETLMAQTSDLLHDTFNGLLAFVVPGTDAYSIHQGVSAHDPGGVDAGAADALIETIDLSTPFVPQFSSQVAALLNGLAQAVNPTAGGSFVSPFARLSFVEKVAVFQIMDGNDSFKVLAGVLPGFVAFFVYSEAGTFDPATRSLTARPLGWTLSNYNGVADGRDEVVQEPTQRPICRAGGMEDGVRARTASRSCLAPSHHSASVAGTLMTSAGLTLAAMPRSTSHTSATARTRHDYDSRRSSSAKRPSADASKSSSFGRLPILQPLALGESVSGRLDARVGLRIGAEPSSGNACTPSGPNVTRTLSSCPARTVSIAAGLASDPAVVPITRSSSETARSAACSRRSVNWRSNAACSCWSSRQPAASRPIDGTRVMTMNSTTIRRGGSNKGPRSMTEPNATGFL